MDGWGDKQWAIYLMPGTMALFIVMLFALPWLSPGSFALEPFRETFNYLMVVCMALFGYLHVLMLKAALHPEVDMARLLMSGLFLCFALMGDVLGKVRRNFWVGVRTPWTPASDKVWIALTGWPRGWWWRLASSARWGRGWRCRWRSARIPSSPSRSVHPLALRLRPGAARGGQME